MTACPNIKYTFIIVNPNMPHCVLAYPRGIKIWQNENFIYKTAAFENPTILLLDPDLINASLVTTSPGLPYNETA